MGELLSYFQIANVELLQDDMALQITLLTEKDGVAVDHISNTVTLSCDNSALNQSEFCETEFPN